MVADPQTLEPVPRDGQTMGEILMRGNNVMKGYLKNPHATGEAFEGGWFRSGDLAVWHEDGYVEIKDRSKDVIISGGENISSIEVEDVLYRHPDILEAGVVARPDDKWGETPCAFVTLKDGASATEGISSSSAAIRWRASRCRSASCSDRCRRRRRGRFRNISFASAPRPRRRVVARRAVMHWRRLNAAVGLARVGAQS